MALRIFSGLRCGGASLHVFMSYYQVLSSVKEGNVSHTTIADRADAGGVEESSLVVEKKCEI